MEVIVAAPRGFCAGVERAIEIVNRILSSVDPPIYVRKEIVHNRHVVELLRRRGVVFVDSLEEVPFGGTCIFSAHGVSPAVWEEARSRQLKVIDATCPLVTKVHQEVQRHAQAGNTVILIGHEGHDEVLGTMGQAPGRVLLVESEEAVERLEVEDPHRLAYVTQTTLSVDETRGIVAALRSRFPAIAGPRKDDICYATQNRQEAVRRLVRDDHIELLLVVGSANSSNSRRLVEVANAQGAESRLIDGAGDLRDSWFASIRRVGVTAGASAPEDLVREVLDHLRELGGVVREHTVVDEVVTFPLPPELG